MKIANGEMLDILISFNFWPPFRQYFSTKWVKFNLPTALHPSALKPKIKPSNAGKQTTKCHAGTFAMSRAYVRRLPTMASTNDASRSRLWRFTLPSFNLKVNSSMYRERCLGLA